MFAQVNVRDIPQLRVFREHIGELCFEYGVAPSNFHNLMWMAMHMTEVANSKKEIDEYNQVPAHHFDPWVFFRASNGKRC